MEICCCQLRIVSQLQILCNACQWLKSLIIAWCQQNAYIYMLLTAPSTFLLMSCFGIKVSVFCSVNLCEHLISQSFIGFKYIL